VAQRLAAAPDSDAYGLLTLLVQLRYESTGWFKIPGACFYPAPDVDSACVTLVRRPEPLLPLELEPYYHSLVKRSFAQRRKMMLKQLKPYYPLEALHHAFETVGISTLVRAEVLSVQQFVQLTQVLHHEIRNM
jgi:16S rRNA (adenine1518-N6/adenine1519-N6)-dimethyltransferase